MRKPLDLCANGCGVPPKPPSLVVCGKCLDKITATLHVLAGKAPASPEREDGDD